MRCAIYARVSTTDQNCDLQLSELREYCTRRGWEIASEYVDTGWSGAKASRPELDSCMKAAREHRFDAVLVWKLDRFGRSVLDLVDALHHLASWGVRFIGVSQGIDTDTSNPTSRLLLHILAAVAEFERELIRERVKAGIRAAKNLGRCGGRPRRLFCSEQAMELRADGMSIESIARVLGVGRGTIQRFLAVKKPF
jgi:putative DNA-invertase from lambdoid prophage Rac